MTGLGIHVTDLVSRGKNLFENMSFEVSKKQAIPRSAGILFQAERTADAEMLWQAK